MADAPAPELRIDLISDDLALFQGAAMPSVRAWCRRLVFRGHPPETPVTVFRDNALMTRTTIGAASGLKQFQPSVPVPEVTTIDSPRRLPDDGSPTTEWSPPEPVDAQDRADQRPVDSATSGVAQTAGSAASVSEVPRRPLPRRTHPAR